MAAEDCLSVHNEEKYMMPTLIVIFVIIIIVALWAISAQRRLVSMDENVNNALIQIGVQLSNRFDALTALLNLTQEYARHECEVLIDTIHSKRSVITAKSTSDDILGQEEIITEALAMIAMVTEQYPEIKASPMYIKTMNAVQIYENMVRNCCLIYNNNVTKLNRETRVFPASMIAGILGLQKRDYLNSVSKCQGDGVKGTEFLTQSRAVSEPRRMNL